MANLVQNRICSAASLDFKEFQEGVHHPLIHISSNSEPQRFCFRHFYVIRSISTHFREVNAVIKWKVTPLAGIRGELALKNGIIFFVKYLKSLTVETCGRKDNSRFNITGEETDLIHSDKDLRTHAGGASGKYQQQQQNKVTRFYE